MRISRELCFDQDELDWQYSKHSVDAENELDSPVRQSLGDDVLQARRR